ncbi:MAG: FAD/NAD(P)-binding protein [Myxococcota bacterium]
MSPSWIIVGGGIHGVHLAARLIGEGGCRAEEIQILDPADALLERWRACTAATGMTHLRSPSVHHLDLEAWSLQRFAGKRRNRSPGLFAAPYERPALDLFDAHCDRVIETYGLDALHVRGRAAACQVDCESVTVATDDGQVLEAGQVVFAVGVGDQPQWPDWVPSDDSRVEHIFARDFSFPAPEPAQRIAVVGGGISAAQVGLRLAGAGHSVHLISRHPVREHQFDSDPGWLGPKFMDRFAREPSFAKRRTTITEARHRGSVPPDVRHSLRCAVEAGRIAWHEADVRDLVHEQGLRRLVLSTGREVEVAHVLLATGFASGRPGGTLVDDLIESAALPCAQCGYPIVDKALRWHPRVFVSGALAELELGPSARNIAGARRAGDRIVPAARSVAAR